MVCREHPGAVLAALAPILGAGGGSIRARREPIGVELFTLGAPSPGADLLADPVPAASDRPAGGGLAPHVDRRVVGERHPPACWS